MAYGRRGFRGNRKFSQKVGVQGQGGMRADFSGVSGIIRHAVDNTLLPQGIGLESGKAMALPLLIYTGNSGNSSGDPLHSTNFEYADGSRVNHIQINAQVVQSDTTKPNNCYVGFISTSFSDAMLDATNMTEQFNDLIEVDDSTTGTFKESIFIETLTLKEYYNNSRKRHWIRGLARNAYTLYSGRPAQINTVIRVPPKNRRGQFGSGLWMVFLNDSEAIQNVSSGASNVNVSCRTFFKEIPQLATPVNP